MSTMSIVFIINFVMFIVSVQSHTWIACTTYDVANKWQSPRGPSETDPIRLNYDDSKCGGYARNWAQYATNTFGQDLGANFIQSGNNLCRNDPINYTTKYHKASYESNGVICLAYPAKNHVATSANPFIPDNGIALYRTLDASNRAPQLGAGIKEMRSLNGVHENGVVDYKGYQQCE